MLSFVFDFCIIFYMLLNGSCGVTCAEYNSLVEIAFSITNFIFRLPVTFLDIYLLTKLSHKILIPLTLSYQRL